MSVCLSVCLSVTRRHCIKTVARIKLIFCVQVSLDPCSNVYRVSSKIGLLSLWNFVVNSGFRKCKPTVDKCGINIDSCRSKVDSTWRRWPRWQVLSTVNDDRRLLNAPDVQPCLQDDGRLGTREREATSRGSIGVSWYTCCIFRYIV